MKIQMLFYFGLLPLLFCLRAEAVTVEIQGKSGARMFFSERSYTLPSTAGEVSIDALENGGVPYEGGTYGLSKIFDLGNEIVVVSDSEIKAYGWCFSIDGKVPETMADKTSVIDQSSKLIWYYAYAHYKNGNWIGQCVPDKVVE